MRLRIKDKETAHIDIAVCGEWCACIESKMGLLSHKGQVLIAFVFPHIVGNHKAIFTLFSVGLRQGNGVLLRAKRGVS
jgi:hypothetical protein